MTRYRVTEVIKATLTVDVEAEHEDNAMENAHDIDFEDWVWEEMDTLDSSIVEIDADTPSPLDTPIPYEVTSIANWATKAENANEDSALDHDTQIIECLERVRMFFTNLPLDGAERAQHLVTDAIALIRTHALDAEHPLAIN